MNKRFALIDNASGFVWGVVDADTPVAACSKLDESLGEFGREYSEVSRSDLFANSTAYHVHEAPAGFDVDDGQNDDQIAKVSALPKIAIISIDWSDPTE